jgi:hypothetical protein
MESKFRSSEENEKLKKAFDDIVNSPHNTTTCADAAQPKVLDFEGIKNWLDLLKEMSCIPRIVEVFVNNEIKVENIDFDKIKHKIVAPLIHRMCGIPVHGVRFIEKNQVLFIIKINGMMYGAMIKVKFKKEIVK